METHCDTFGSWHAGDSCLALHSLKEIEEGESVGTLGTADDKKEERKEGREGRKEQLEECRLGGPARVTGLTRSTRTLQVQKKSQQLSVARSPPADLTTMVELDL